jgi:hypothetical protein
MTNTPYDQNAADKFAIFTTAQLENRPTPLMPAYLASDYAADGFSFDDFIHDETETCEVCGERRVFSAFDAQIKAGHPRLTWVCEDCADDVLIQWAA